MTSGRRAAMKRALGVLPGAAEAYQRFRSPGQPAISGYRLDRLAAALPAWAAAAGGARARKRDGSSPKRVLVMGLLPWWVEYAGALALLLAAEGHEVDLGLLPYRMWAQEVEEFDARRQAVYLRDLFAPARSLVAFRDLLSRSGGSLPASLRAAIEAQSLIDTQYTLQRESVRTDAGEEDSPLYRLRLQRNMAAAAASYRLLKSRTYDAVIIPNGSILEFGAVYHVARYLAAPVVTYEFGEQRERMWLAQDQEVMRQDTTALWQARGDLPLRTEEAQALSAMLQARRGGKRWANSRRQWQSAPGQGAERMRRILGIDATRPVVLVCTNVVADSLALGRQVFTDGMTDWLAQVVRHLAQSRAVQLVVRVHPGELLGAGHPSVEIVQAELPQLPPHVIVIPPESKVNTYDVIELAQVGLVYTSTVGLEMAMSGLPVIVAGQTHYRGKGFTVDPSTPSEFLGAIDSALRSPRDRTTVEAQVELAQRYAYRYFFEYPFRFPWHLVTFWDDVAARPFEEVVRDEGLSPYRRTLEALTGQPIDWGSARDDLRGLA